MFLLNKKIYSKEQIEELKLPFSLAAEIPQIEDQTKVIPSLINNYFLKIIKATPFFLRNYLNNKIFL